MSEDRSNRLAFYVLDALNECLYTAVGYASAEQVFEYVSRHLYESELVTLATIKTQLRELAQKGLVNSGQGRYLLHSTGASAFLEMVSERLVEVRPVRLTTIIELFGELDQNNASLIEILLYLYENRGNSSKRALVPIAEAIYGAVMEGITEEERDRSVSECLYFLGENQLVDQQEFTYTLTGMGKILVLGFLRIQVLLNAEMERLGKRTDS